MNDVLSFQMKKEQDEDNRKIFHNPTINQGIKNVRYRPSSSKTNGITKSNELTETTKNIYDKSNFKIPVGTSLNKLNAVVGQNVMSNNRYTNTLDLYHKPNHEDTKDVVYYGDYYDDGIYRFSSYFYIKFPVKKPISHNKSPESPYRYNECPFNILLPIGCSIFMGCC